VDSVGDFSLARIAVAIDGSAHADHGLDAAIALAQKFQSELTILAIAPLVSIYVSSTEPWVPTEIPESAVKRYREVVDAGVARAQKAGLSSVSGVCLEGVVVDELVSYVEQHPQDLLVLASRGLSTAKRLLLGSVSDAVVHHAKCPVLIFREPAVPAGERPTSTPGR